jgi:thioredoxin reductase
LAAYRARGTPHREPNSAASPFARAELAVMLFRHDALPEPLGPRTLEVMNDPWDCVVIGGGAAGLSAALVLGRARTRTLLVDAGEQSNRPATGIGGLLGHDGRRPDELYEAGRRELAAYPTVEVRTGRATAVASARDGFAVTTADGRTEHARRLLLATGMDYRIPPVEGLAERWGRSVFHCPFCHGWEVRDRPLAVLDDDPETGVHRALLLTSWSLDVTLLTGGRSRLTFDSRRRLGDAGVDVDDREVRAVRGADGDDDLAAVVFADGSERACRGLLVAAVLHRRDDLADQLGLALAPPTPIAADAVAAGPMGETSVSGVYVAGDAAAGMPSVANAVAAGSNAAAAVVRSLRA